jgi:hypothetical protein
MVVFLLLELQMVVFLLLDLQMVVWKYQFDRCCHGTDICT